MQVQQILAELWSLTVRIVTYFSLSSQLLLHPRMDLNEMLYHTSRSACGKIIHVRQILAELCPSKIRIIHILVRLLNSSYILAWI